MPVANQGEDKNQNRDDQQTRGFQAVNVSLGVSGLGRGIAPRLWTGGSHGHIVSPAKLSRRGGL